MSDMSNESFEIRHATMGECSYPEEYQPYHLGQGYISRFDNGAHGLNSFSAPNHVLPIYVSNSKKSPEGFSYDKMDKHRYFWPMPDEAYARFLVKPL
jgi:hypothetical protein